MIETPNDLRILFDAFNGQDESTLHEAQKAITVAGTQETTSTDKLTCELPQEIRPSAS